MRRGQGATPTIQVGSSAQINVHATLKPVPLQRYGTAPMATPPRRHAAGAGQIAVCRTSARCNHKTVLRLSQRRSNKNTIASPLSQPGIVALSVVPRPPCCATSSVRGAWLMPRRLPRPSSRCCTLVSLIPPQRFVSLTPSTSLSLLRQSTCSSQSPSWPPSPPALSLSSRARPRPSRPTCPPSSNATRTSRLPCWRRESPGPTGSRSPSAPTETYTSKTRHVGLRGNVAAGNGLRVGAETVSTWFCWAVPSTCWGQLTSISICSPLQRRI